MATPEPKPVISEQTALLCELLFTLFYVAPFYLSATLRSTPFHSRDAPTVIRARVRAVVLTCLACTVVTVYVLAFVGNASLAEVLRLLGVWPVDPLDTLKVLALVAVLFSCSLYESVVVDSEWQAWSLVAFREATFDSWTGYRNLVVAPISEEVVFRSLSIPLFLLAKSDPTHIVFTTPLVFGLAHVHHLVEFLQARTPKGSRLPPISACLQGIARSLFQFAYTSLFGFFAAFVFLRTGNIWAAILAHSFCNRMGLPRLWGKVGQFAEYDYLPSELKAPSPVGDGKKDDDNLVKVGNSLMEDKDVPMLRSVEDLPPERPKNLGMAWTVVYYLLVLLGSYGFYELLFPLTRSQFALVKF
jgi:prenyl protein peptidase